MNPPRELTTHVLFENESGARGGGATAWDIGAISLKSQTSRPVLWYRWAAVQGGRQRLVVVMRPRAKGPWRSLMRAHRLVSSTLLVATSLLFGCSDSVEKLWEYPSHAASFSSGVAPAGESLATQGMAFRRRCS